MKSRLINRRNRPKNDPEWYGTPGTAQPKGIMGVLAQ